MRHAKLIVTAMVVVVGLIGVFASRSKAELVDDNTPVPAVGTEGGPARMLTGSELAMWVRGRRVFDRDFHTENGLGMPEFNGDSCRGCHQRPGIGGAGGVDLNVSRFGSDNGGAGPFTNLPGGQINHRFRRADTAGREDHPAGADVFEQRQTPSLFGLGLVELVPESEILANADPNDSNGDGIFGYARFIDINGVMELGRFGWKAGLPSLADFARGAVSNELGVTVPDVTRGFGIASDTDVVPDPEISTGDLDDLTFFMQELAAPPRGGSTSPLVAYGETVFDSIGCDDCHVPTLQSSIGPISPYSNFLLHDVQPPGFRGMEEPDAPSGFYRTPPLWGIIRTAPYWHDGSAETLTDAIQMHNGEAANATIGFLSLSAGDREALLTFLADL